MRLARLFLTLVGTILVLASTPLHAKPKKLTVTGKLTYVMAIGGETTGWSIELNPTITLDGKELHAIEVQSSDTPKLDSLKDQFVQAKGTLSSTTGVETGQRAILQISSIRPVKPLKPKTVPSH